MSARTPEHNAKIGQAGRRHWAKTFEQRVLASLDRSRGPDACWPWTGSRDSKGYERLKAGGRTIKAHRAVYTLLVGPIPDNLFLIHTCPGGDNPWCCNPAHLRPGTRLDNAHDAVERGQQVQGERHHAAKLTVEQVAQIRHRFEDGETQTWLAHVYGVSQHAIWTVVRYHQWKHVA